jgi:hypothetical protein|tara:strand:+ start:119 stop:286 length:168 start_codon:yes stop_codon:yes gene_type:complete
MSLEELMEDAGGRQAPMRVVLGDMADTIRTLVENKPREDEPDTSMNGKHAEACRY